MPSRRDLLLATAGTTTLGGCLSSLSASSGPGPESLPRSVRVSHVDSVRDPSASVGIEMVHDRVTSERTAELRVAVRNDGDGSRRFDLSCRSVLDPVVFDTERTYLLTLPSAEFDGECWHRTGDRPLASDSCDTTVRLAPGESWSNELRLWSNRSGCAPTGEYRFIDRVSFLDRGQEFGFELAVTDD